MSFALNHKFEDESHNILRSAKLLLLTFVFCSWKGVFTHQEFLIMLADHYSIADVSKHNV